MRSECEKAAEWSCLNLCVTLVGIGQRSICMGSAPDGERWLIALHGGRRVNVKMSNVKPAGDLDAEIVQRETTSAVPLKGPEDPPSRAMIEAHNLTHLPTAPWSEICVQARGRSDWHTQVNYDSEIPCVQMDFQFISGVAVWCPEAQTKGTVLTMVDMNTGYVGVLMLSGKSPDNFTVRSSSSFVDKWRAEKTRLRYENELAMRLLAEKIAAVRHPRTTILEPINRAEHQSGGGVESAHQSVQAATRALRMDIRARTGEDIVPGDALFQWMVRHAHGRTIDSSLRVTEAVPLGNQNGYVLQESFASFHGSVHDKSAD